MQQLFTLLFVMLITFVACGLYANDGIHVSPTDWPWWRGPQRNGIASPEQHPPITWSDTKNIVWKTPVPGRGHGSPTVVGDQIFLSTADEERAIQSILCYDRRTGELKWRNDVHDGPLNFKNSKASQASCTIACDGERIFVNFLNNGVVYTTALTRNGEQIWQKKVCNYVVHQGYGSSPAVYQSLVIVTADNKGGGAIVAFDRETGSERWRQSRPSTPNYPSPVIFTAAGREQLLLSGCNLVSSFDPLSGAKLWETKGATTECVTTTVTDGQLMFTSGGYPRNHVSAVRTDGSGTVVWQNTVRVYVPSMIARDGYLYAVADAGIAVCWKCDSGKEIWKQRLRGTFSSSPVMVKDRIYVTNEAGTTFVLEATPRGCSVLAENQLGEEVFASPAICDSRLYCRVAEYEDDDRREFLYCVGGN